MRHPTSLPTAIVLFLGLLAPPRSLRAQQGPAAAQMPPAFRLAAALRDARPRVRWAPDGRLVLETNEAGGTTLRALDPRTDSLSPYAPPAKPPAAAEPRIVEPGLFTYSAPVREVASPDGGWLAGTRGGQLWVRSADGKDSLRLTKDGRPEDGYDVRGAKWSPDGSRIAVKKLDARGVPTVPLVRWGEPGEPVVRHPYSHVGEPIVRASLAIADRRGGGVVPVQLGEGEDPYLFIVGWSADGKELYFTRMSRLMKRLRLFAADARTGRSRVVLTETSSTFIGGLLFLRGYDHALERFHYVTPLADGRRFVWTSEREGWRRLYLYDFSGKLLRPLTPAGSEVRRLEAVDEARGLVYYTARVDSARPYDLSLMRVSLQGGAPKRLVTGPVFGHLELGPKRDFFVDERDGIDLPPVLELRRADGKLVRELWSGEPIARREGWEPPEQVTEKAADGTTDLYGVLFRPRSFDPGSRYPVVEEIYLGPQTSNVPRSLLWQSYAMCQALADQGYVVVVLDARGTPDRGRAFQDAFYGEFGQHEIADHVAFLKELAADRPYMDLDRVGVIGHSWGGYGVLRAMLQAPELYRVGVASSPGVDLDGFRVSIEPFMGCLPASCPDAYRAGASTALVGRLRGHLLLMHGTGDEDVPFGQTVHLVSALEKAGKPYDLAIFPGAGHMIMQSRYWWPRLTGYLREHLRP